MPYISNTPESLLPRSDSRNPANTCRGITTQGRPCRRGITPSTNPSPASITRKKSARHESVDVDSLYCWQHKDQASTSIPLTQVTIPEDGLKPRTSIDTLMDRLGVLEINDGKQKPPGRRHTNQGGLGGKPQSRPKKKKRSFCCFEIVDEESDEDSRPSIPTHRPPQSFSQGRPQNGRIPSSGQQKPSRPSAQNPKKSSKLSSQSWVPASLEPQTASNLHTELAKPISDADDEGYIYMFWVTPQTETSRGNGPAQPAVTRDIASSLLPSTTHKDSTLRPPAQPRSVSDAIQAARDLNALTRNPTSTSPGTLRLKIGRTSNVHRRLTEWTRQCSHDLTLIRYYPYTPSSSINSSPARSPHRAPANSLVPGRKVPHVHRVERLIHLELASLRIRDLGQCSECGKEHREWFEVEAQKEALRKVDECIRRWISWGESMK